jgi:hypothetical protein
MALILKALTPEQCIYGVSYYRYERRLIPETGLAELSF